MHPMPDSYVAAVLYRNALNRSVCDQRYQAPEGHTVLTTGAV